MFGVTKLREGICPGWRKTGEDMSWLEKGGMGCVLVGERREGMCQADKTRGRDMSGVARPKTRNA